MHTDSKKYETPTDANNVLCEVFSCISKKADTPKEKYNQLKKDFENLTTDAEKMMQITIKHALKQSALVGGYSGFLQSFWIDVMSEHLA
jgi:molecular chaperone GrpE (heat shock protein)